MKTTLLEIGYYNKRIEWVLQLLKGRNYIKLKKIAFERNIIRLLYLLEINPKKSYYYLKELEVQLTELKGVKNGQRTRII